MNSTKKRKLTMVLIFLGVVFAMLYLALAMGAITQEVSSPAESLESTKSVQTAP